MRIYRMPLILLSVIAILAALAYWDEQQTSRDVEARKNEKRLFNVNSDEIDQLTLMNPKSKHPLLRFQRDESIWKIVEPVKEVAEQSAVSELIDSLLEYSYERSIGKKEIALDDFGFGRDQENTLVKLKTNDNHEFGLELGSKTPTGYSLYLRKLDGEEVLVGGQFISNFMDKNLFDFRRKNLELPSINAIETITFLGGQKQTELSFKNLSGIWHFSNNERTSLKIDQAALVDMIAALRNASILQYIDKPTLALTKVLSGQNPGTQNIGSLDLALKDSSVLSYRFVENNDQIYLIVGGQERLIVLDKGIKSLFDKTEIDFLNRDIFDFDPSVVTGLTINGKTFQYLQDKWLYEDRPEEKVNGFLSWLSRLRATQLVATDEALEKADLSAKPKFSLQLSLQNNIVITFKVWQAKDSDQVFLKKESEQNLYQVSSELTKNLESLLDANGAKPQKT
jgi:hypothetical protein